MQHLSTKADYHCSPKAEWRSCSTTVKNLWIPSRVVLTTFILYILQNKTNQYDSLWGWHILYPLIFVSWVWQSKEEEGKTKQWQKIKLITPRPDPGHLGPHLDHQCNCWRKEKAGFAVLNYCSSGIVLPTLAASAFCEDQNDAALNQGLARLGKVGHACLSSAASTHWHWHWHCQKWTFFVGICPTSLSKTIIRVFSNVYSNCICQCQWKRHQ